VRLSRAALGQWVDLDQSYINRLESGEREPPKSETVLALAEALALDYPARQRLLVAAGHPTDWSLAVEPDDPTMIALAHFLADPAISQAAKRDLRAALGLLLARWRRTDG
jgi:transcriptional regulator with XRE-family HTH domain